MRGLLSQARGAESQARLGEMGIEAQQKRENVIASQPGAVQEAIRVPEIQQVKTLARQERVAELQEQKATLDIEQTKRVNAAYEGLSGADKFAVDFPDVAKIKSGERIAGMELSSRAGTAAANRASQERIAAMDREQTERNCRAWSH